MAQIKGRNIFHSYRMIKRSDSELSDNAPFDIVKEVLRANALKVFYNPDKKGFVSYPLDPRLAPENLEPIDASIVGDIIPIKYIEYNKRRAKTERDVIISMIRKTGSYHDPAVIENLEKYLMKDKFKSLYQDLIFIPRAEDIILVFPGANETSILDNIANKYFSKYFGISRFNETRDISNDVLDWIVWQVKGKKDGKIDPYTITSIEGYNSTAFLDEGNLSINQIDQVEDNLHSKLALVLGQGCNKVLMSIERAGKIYKFELSPEGKFTPNWPQCNAYDSGNIVIDRINTLKDISLNIIPHINAEYKKGQAEWMKNKPVIQAELNKEIKDVLI